jgi:cell pole-organizing protein PopZ
MQAAAFDAIAAGIAYSSQCPQMASEISPQPDSQAESLAELVRQRRAATTNEVARLIAAFPDPDQRHREARREIHMAMIDHALGRLTDAERDRILVVLRPSCPDVFAASLETRLPELPGLE